MATVALPARVPVYRILVGFLQQSLRNDLEISIYRVFSETMIYQRVLHYTPLDLYMALRFLQDPTGRWPVGPWLRGQCLPTPTTGTRGREAWSILAGCYAEMFFFMSLQTKADWVCSD